ncbi:MAG TPA: 5-formyltetrahydrofolate cyclo-ligase [Gammaproteobacteria bacterium]|nr:5-formyltetrahydrofolate cyclo-ligase [Gammaproteobacteria bacterium]
MTEDTRQAVRESLRQTRRDLNQEQQAVASQGLFELIHELDIFSNAKRIAFYQPIDGEVDPSLLLKHALREGKSCFLPRISDENPEFVSFAPYDENTKLKNSDWGIAEPPAPETIPSPTDLDLVFVPLVAFDRYCSRLGMGKGFYDRTFNFKIFNPQSRPLLIGLAHECQYAEPFSVKSWDVRLDAVITATKIHRPDTE